MTAHADRIRQAEDRSGVYHNLPWEVGDIADDPDRENLPEGTVLVDEGGFAWQLIGSEWLLTGDRGPIAPRREWGPYVVAWLPKENSNE